MWGVGGALLLRAFLLLCVPVIRKRPLIVAWRRAAGTWMVILPRAPRVLVLRPQKALMENAEGDARPEQGAGGGSQLAPAGALVLMGNEPRPRGDANNSTADMGSCFLPIVLVRAKVSRWLFTLTLVRRKGSRWFPTFGSLYGLGVLRGSAAIDLSASRQHVGQGLPHAFYSPALPGGAAGGCPRERR